MNKVLLAKKLDALTSSLVSSVSDAYGILKGDQEKYSLSFPDVVYLDQCIWKFSAENGLNIQEKKHVLHNLILSYKEWHMHLTDVRDGNVQSTFELFSDDPDQKGLYEILISGIVFCQTALAYLLEEIQALENIEREATLLSIGSSDKDQKGTPEKFDQQLTSGESPANKIWWTGSARQLAYLIEQLEKFKLININGEINKVIKEHFIDKNKNQISDSIKQNRSSATSIKGREHIDTVIKSTKSTEGE